MAHGKSTARGQAARSSGGPLLVVALLGAAVLALAIVWTGGGDERAGASAGGGAEEAGHEVARPVGETATPASGAEAGRRARGAEGATAPLAGVAPEHRAAARLAAADVEDAARARFDVPILVRGVALDARSGRGVAGAEVSLTRSAGGVRGRATTDADGRFELRWGAGVTTDVAVVHPAYVDAHRPGLALEGEPYDVASSDGAPTLSVPLTPSGRIAGLVLGTGAVRAAAPEAELRALAWHAATSSERLWAALEAPVAEDGTFAFTDLVPGDYVVTAEVPGRAVPLQAGLHVDAGEELLVRLDTLLPATVAGRVVVRADGEEEPAAPVAGARVSLAADVRGLPDDALVGRRAEAVSDADGAFVFAGLAPGDYTARVTLPWGERLRRDVRVEVSGAHVELELACAPPARLAGAVVDADGEPVAAASLAVFPAGDGRRVAQLADWTFDDGVPRARTDARGGFELAGVATRTPLAVAVRPAGGGVSALERLPALEPGEACADVRLELPAAGRLRGVVRGPDGAGLPRAELELYRAKDDGLGARLALATTDARGAFGFEGVPSGEVVVFAQAEGLLPVRALARVDVDGAPAEVDLRLFEALEVEGVALDEEGRGVPGVPVHLRLDPESTPPPEHARRQQRRYAVTDAYGRFRFTGLFDASWLVDASSFEWELAGADPPQLVPSRTAFTTLTLRPRERDERFAIRGLVETADGSVPTGVRIEGLRGGVLELDAGRFVATGLTPTRHRLQVFADGHRRAFVGPIDPVPGGEVDLGRIVLPPAADVQLRVQDPRGRAVEGAEVFLAPFPEAEGGPVDQRRVTLEHRRGDRYSTGQAERARYRVVVRAEGFARFARVLDLTGRADHGERIRLERE